MYEYFLSRFAAAEGKGGGEFYTPQSVVKLLVEMIEPYKGRVYDPCCGSGGMFVQSEGFVEAHGGRLTDLSIYGQESNPTTWRLCKMNLAIRGIEAKIGSQPADTFHNNLHKDLRADYILANPSFNDEDWGYSHLKGDPRWEFGGEPPSGGKRKDSHGNERFVDGGNSNFAWIQHFIYHLAPNGMAGFVLANGSMTSNTGGEGEIRKALIEADLVDCMVALPSQLFYTTGIPACLWFLSRDKQDGRFRDRRGEVLFIDARKLGYLVDRTHRELSDEELSRICRIYHAWRGKPGAGNYEDVAGFCNGANAGEVARNGFVLNPGRYVGAAVLDEENEPFERKLSRCSKT